MFISSLRSSSLLLGAALALTGCLGPSDDSLADAGATDAASTADGGAADANADVDAAPDAAVYTLSFDSFGNQVKLRRIVDGEVVATESLAATGGRVIATPDRAYVLLRVRGNAVLWGTSVSDGVTPALVVAELDHDLQP